MPLSLARVSEITLGNPVDPVAYATLTGDEQDLVMRLQQSVLESVALGVEHHAVVTRICLLGEAAIPNSVASCMLLDGSGQHLNVFAAPSIPESGVNLLNGLCPGPGAGSCGNAVYRGEPVYVENTLSDPRWCDLRHLAKDFGIGACWSMPIRAEGGRVIGSFAISSFEHRPPSLFHRKLLEICAHLISIVLARQQAEARIAFLASHDPLTALPNRTLIRDRLEHALAQAQRQRGQCAVLFVDLDNFKQVNDRLGHTVGDRLLADIAQAIRQPLRASDSVGRWGGDEFLVLLPDIRDEADIRRIAEMLMQGVRTIHTRDGQPAGVTFSIGIARYPEDARDTDELIHKADAAMYQAKASGRNGIRFFDQALQAGLDARARLIADLRQAIADEAFEVHYQPQVDLAGETLGAEALVRWRHPARGLLGPLEFIGLAEETGLIVDMGRQVMQQACARLRAWQEGAETAARTVSVNISPRQFRQDDFVESALAVIEAACIDPSGLVFEVTESMLLDDIDAVAAKMRALKAVGVQFAIDDFGTGYSSLAYLRRLPLDELKIDRAFVMDIERDEDAAAICGAFVGLARLLRLRVVAEGVETEGQRRILSQQYPCDALQGYLFGKPAPLSAAPGA